MPEKILEGSVYKMKLGNSIKVLEYNSATNLLIEFISTGTKLSVEAAQVRRRNIKDPMHPTIYGVGFFGIGKHIAFSEGKMNLFYSRWRDVLKRCYDSKFQIKHPTYIDCTVAPIWHNYQNFADWLEQEIKILNTTNPFQINKDIKFPGNKIYSPDTCILVTAQKNAEFSLAKNWKFRSPEGKVVEIYNLNKFCKENNLSIGNMSMVHSGKSFHTKRWTKA